MLSSGEIRFRPQSFSFCGHCDEYFLKCTCEDVAVARDFHLKSLPYPPVGASPESLLRRFCGCVAQSASMGRFAAVAWYADHAAKKMAAVAAKKDDMVAMVEDYVSRLARDPALPLLMKALGLEQRTTAADGANRIAEEARAALVAFVAGDWCTVTRMGALLLNNAFQSSDADRFPLSDQQLADCFCAVDVLNKVLGLGYSDRGWGLCLEQDRPPSVSPRIHAASTRLKALADKPPPVDDDLFDTTFLPHDNLASCCRCGSLSHKRTNHSSCPLNPKRKKIPRTRV